MSQLPTWVPVLQALLTPTIAVAALGIAGLQLRLNQLKLKHDLFDRRVKILETTRDFVSHVIATGDVDRDELVKYRMGIINCRALFPPDISEYLWNLWKEGNALRLLETQVRSAPSPSTELMDKIDARAAVFQDALVSDDNFSEKLLPYIQLDHRVVPKIWPHVVDLVHHRWFWDGVLVVAQITLLAYLIFWQHSN